MKENMHEKDRENGQKIYSAVSVGAAACRDA
jgi:hypothetical protein